MDRKNKTLTTPSGIQVELKEYISAGEFLDATETKDGADLSKSELAKRLVQTAIVSLNGSSENVAVALRDLPLPDYIFISKEVAKLTNADFTEAKIQ
jgi:phenylpyruvate tautomerase PptA (4-oxalocrotonate tautomerase family)